MIRGHRLEEVVAAGLAPSVRWLQDQIRAGCIPAHKIGRHWVMTDADLEIALASWESHRIRNQEPPAASPRALSLTSTSLRRAARTPPPAARA